MALEIFHDIEESVVHIRLLCKLHLHLVEVAQSVLETKLSTVGKDKDGDAIIGEMKSRWALEVAIREGALVPVAGRHAGGTEVGTACEVCMGGLKARLMGVDGGKRDGLNV